MHIVRIQGMVEMCMEDVGMATVNMAELNMAGFNMAVMGMVGKWLDPNPNQ